MINFHWDQGATAMRTAATRTLVTVAYEDTADKRRRAGWKGGERERQTDRQRQGQRDRGKERQRDSIIVFAAKPEAAGRRVTHIAESHPIISSSSSPAITTLEEVNPL